MDRNAQAYEQLTEAFVEWAQTEQAVRMAFVVGSRARVDHPADEGSDLDIVFVVTDANPYLSATGWIEGLGNPRLMFIQEQGDGLLKERRVLFEGGLGVDFIPIPDVWRGLFATMDLFRWLSVETAERLGYSYPVSGAEYATEPVKSLCPGDC